VVAMFLVWLSDLLDGRIARRMGQAGMPFGKAMDSSVDFVLIYGLFITFYAAGRLVTYQFAFIYLAMLTILSLQITLMGTGRSEETATTTLGKLTGALQYAFLLFLVVLEVLPASGTVAMLRDSFFAVLAAAIVINSIECVQLIVRMVRTQETGSAGASEEQPRPS